MFWEPGSLESYFQKYAYDSEKVSKVAQLLLFKHAARSMPDMMVWLNISKVREVRGRVTGVTNRGGFIISSSEARAYLPGGASAEPG